jgi:hypothetical protein
MVEQIKDENGIVICHIIRGNYSPATTEFFTPDNYSQQLGIIKYPEGAGDTQGKGESKPVQ